MSIESQKTRGISDLVLAIALVAWTIGCGQGSRPGDVQADAGDTGSDTGDDTDTGTAIAPSPGWGDAQGYSLSWAVQAGGEYYAQDAFGNEGDRAGDTAWSVSPTLDGDVFLAGRIYSHNAFFGLGTENEITYDVNVRGSLYLARYHGTGVPVWVATIRRPSLFEVTSVVGLDGGGAVIAGRTYHHPDYPTVFGAGEPGEVVLDVSCDTCPFLARYRGDGTLDWAVAGDGYRAGIRGMDVTPSGDLCVSGGFDQWVTFDDGTAEGITLTNEGGDDGFAGRFGPDGKARWVVAVDDEGDGHRSSYCRVIAMSDDSCVFGFAYHDYAVVNGWDGESMSFVAEPESDGGAVVARFGPQGDLEWASDLGLASLTGSAGAYDVSMVELDGDVVASSGFNGSIRVGNGEDEETISPGPSPRNVGFFFTRLDGQDGHRLWTSVALGENGGGDILPLDVVYASAALPDGGFLVGGGFSGRKVFGAGEENETELIAKGWDCDAFLAAFEDDGTLRWASRIVATADWSLSAIPWGEIVYGVAVTDTGSIFAAGQFQGYSTFGTGPEDATEMLSMGSYDAFLLRLDPDGIPPAR
jgi:hypothetical protein